jgi:hypothetical protein
LYQYYTKVIKDSIFELGANNRERKEREERFLGAETAQEWRGFLLFCDPLSFDQPSDWLDCKSVLDSNVTFIFLLNSKAANEDNNNIYRKWIR